MSVAAGSASSCTVRDVLAGGSPTTPSVGVTSFPPPFETLTVSMAMEDVVEIDPGNLRVSMAMGDVVEIDAGNLSVGWEIESSGTDYMSGGVVVKGRLKNHISFWREVIKAPATIISTIEGGYVLPLKSEPTAYMRGNHQSACKNSLFIQESLSELCTTGCAVEVSATPVICSPLSVVENSSGKKRLVINLRHLNQFLWKQKFKYEDLRVAMLLLEKGDYMFSFDLKSGYHHVDIAKEHWKYLGFSWESRFYVFTVLPFSLSSACYIFTKLVRPLVRYWRERGLRVIVYLDDGLCAMGGESNALEASTLVQSTLSQAGFVANVKKSIWKPTQRLQWLGFVIDLSQGQIEAHQSSTWRELTAVLRVLSAVAVKLMNFLVRWFTDNQNVARILLVGSKMALLQATALKIFSLSVQYQIRFEPQWIPRGLNERADYLSRIIDYDDWQLNPLVFSELDNAWVPHTVDRFASFQNSQVPRFNSRCWNPGSEAVDAFTVDWSGENNWWCPPISLIPRVIRHAQACGAKGSIVVPLWPSAPFWPMLCPFKTGCFATFVRDVRELPQVDSLFLPGLSGAVLFNGEVPNTQVLALRCDFSGVISGKAIPYAGYPVVGGIAS